MNTLKRFLLDEAGQDLTEYGLLLVFVLMATAGVLLQTGTAVHPIWAAESTTMQEAALQTS
jgi:Flp pilus assembly pilin Flp